MVSKEGTDELRPDVQGAYLSGYVIENRGNRAVFQIVIEAIIGYP